MPLQLIPPSEQRLMRHVIDHRAVIEHVRLVLLKYLGDPTYSKFYIGITQDVERRLREHQLNKPDYKWMIPIYEETGVPQAEGFSELEQLAIRTFGPQHGKEFTHPNAPPGRKLVFDNRRQNPRPQNTLYVLVG